MRHPFEFVPFALVVLSLMGCASKPPQAAPADEEIITLSFQSPKRPKSELRALERRAHDGDAEAAFELHAYYSFSVESDAEKSRRFFKRAVELEHPAALFRVGFDEWCYREHPDVARAERYVKRALELGYPDDKGLLVEIEEAKSTGRVPRRSAFRLFPDMDASK